MIPAKTELIQVALNAAQSGIPLTDKENEVLNLAFIKSQIGFELTDKEIRTLKAIAANRARKERKP